MLMAILRRCNGWLRIAAIRPGVFVLQDVSGCRTAPCFLPHVPGLDHSDTGAIGALEHLIRVGPMFVISAGRFDVSIYSIVPVAIACTSPMGFDDRVRVDEHRSPATEGSVQRSITCSTWWTANSSSRPSIGNPTRAAARRTDTLPRQPPPRTLPRTARRTTPAVLMRASTVHCCVAQLRGLSAPSTWSDAAARPDATATPMR